MNLAWFASVANYIETRSLTQLVQGPGLADFGTSSVFRGFYIKS